MFTRAFVKALLERAVKTFAQALAAYLTAAGVSDVVDVDWKVALGVAALSTLYSVLTSVGSGAVNEDSSPSLTTETLTAP